MPLFKVQSAPHFIQKTPEATADVRTELQREYADFLRFILASQGEMGLHMRSVDGRDGRPTRVELFYEIAEDSQDLRSYLRTLKKSLRLEKCDLDLGSSGHGPKRRLKRRVELLAVGTLDKVSHSNMQILPENAPRYANFDPRVTGQTTLSQVLLAPVVQMASSMVADKFTPGIAYLIPISQGLGSSSFGMDTWRSTLATLMQVGGQLSIRAKRYEYRDSDIEYALLCLQYFLGTNGDKLAIEQINATTPILRTVFSKMPIFSLDICFHGESSMLPLAFQRDVDPEAFELSPTLLERSLVNRKFPMNRTSDSPVVSRNNRPIQEDRRPLTGPVRLERAVDNRTLQGSSALPVPAARYAELFVMDELLQIFTPPYTFRDALPGLVHHVPKPFQEPALPGAPDAGHSLTVGYLDTGQEVTLPLRALSRHVFVTGASGAGKSNTMMNLIATLHNDHQIPVLMVDPVKRDFEPLASSLRPPAPIYDFRKRWLRFNPFIPAPSITLYSHSVVLAKAFAMLFPTNAVAYEILLSMIKQTYWVKLSRRRDKSNPLTTEFFVQKTGRDLRSDSQAVPTFLEFMDIGLELLKESSGGQKPSPWLQDALEHFERRWANLRRSAFSLMLTPKDPMRTIDHLFSESALLELGAWFDQNEANAAFALVFSMMYEQRLNDFELATSEGRVPPLRIALLDEAHRIVPAHAAGGDDRLLSAAQEASTLLSQMIAECRALGQGLILAEQSASKIDPNVLINTSTKIVHTVLYGPDKAFLAAALSLGPSEADFLSYLPVGEALVFAPDNYQPVYTHVPEFNPMGSPGTSHSSPSQKGTIHGADIENSPRS